MKDRINLWTPSEPNGYGAFDDDQQDRFSDRDETIDFCDDCGLPIDDCECN